MTSCHVVLRTCRAPDAILGHIFCFRWGLWVFTYVAWSMIDDYMSPDFRHVTHLTPYWGMFPFRIRYTNLHRGHVLDDRWFHFICSSDLSCTWRHTGAYFRFGWDLRTFMEVTCAMMDVFMTFVLRTYRAPDAILRHIPFRRIFMDLRRGHMFEDRWFHAI